MRKSSNRWALILAAGSGTRLSGLTADGNGTAVPKQFCSLAGGPSLLEETLARAVSVAQPAQTAIVVAAQHARYWQPALTRTQPDNVIVQPCNRGTANGILLGLCSILERDPNAIVTILPSDHYVEREDVLARALERAAAAVEASSAASIAFLGVTPDKADPELGYIVPGAPQGDGARLIVEFVEKPTRAAAARLLRKRALWNSFILVARGSALVDLVERRFAAEVAAFRSLWRQAGFTDRLPRETAELYQRLRTIDFSRDVVQGADATLAVIAAPPCGWSDLGTPERVADVLIRNVRSHRRADEHVRGFDRPAFDRPLSLAEAHARLVGALAPAARTA